ncbi:Clp protease N-terminal domain-containing protein [Motilibacter aurantiacus]|uniref:Clp protease N-terminal domain-containing protein n=1 Tax=Motilibacter aurantiacus TaxID=2714955 RepID=UPI00140E10B3|nr:Clp protease N-terminal domain-containing protein [Motilibacter aurantiacus]NHC43976.1 Clp protease [Motilibacter aurantiacus]
MFERFTKPARAAVVQSQVEARRLGHDRIDDSHLLLGVLAQEAGVGARVLTELGVGLDAARDAVAALHAPDAQALGALGIDLDEVRRKAEAAFGEGALERRFARRRGFFRRSTGHIAFTRPAKAALEDALRQALTLRHNYIGTEHLVLGLLTGGSSTAGRVLHRLGVRVDAAELRRRVLDELGRAA